MSVVLAVFGAAAYSLQYNKLYLTIYGYSFHSAVLVVAFGLGMLLGVFGLDYFYYFKMLIGAVKRGHEIDEAYANRKVDDNKIFGMTTMISNEIDEGKSKQLLGLFYGLIFVLGVVFMIGILLGYTPAHQ